MTPLVVLMVLHCSPVDTAGMKQDWIAVGMELIVQGKEQELVV